MKDDKVTPSRLFDAVLVCLFLGMGYWYAHPIPAGSVAVAWLTYRTKLLQVLLKGKDAD